MLKTLCISNIATIKSVTVDFSGGLNALTGETGAGKSIVVGGLELALGDRVTSDVIRSGENLAVSEATFTEPFPPGVGQYLSDELNIEHATGEPIVLRREISRTGRNRCFINDQMVNLGQLKHVGELLVDLHGQHEHQSLFHSRRHLEALDAFAHHTKLLERYAEAWDTVTSLRQQKRGLEQAAQDFQQRLDFLEFQIQEIEKVEPQPGELEALEIEEQRLAQADTLSRSAAEAYSILDEAMNEQLPLIPRMAEVRRRVEELAGVEKEFEDTLSTLEEMRLFLDDLAARLRQYADTVKADPQRLDEIIARLESLKRLTRKHGGSEESLLAALDDMRERREQLTHSDEERQRIDDELEQAEKVIRDVGKKLSQSRRKAATRFRNQVLILLRELAMEKGDFKVLLEPTDEPLSTGMDHVEFLLTANPGMPPAPLKKVASGGELSRVMLSLKSVMAGRHAVPTLVFDEIDAGISGETCRRVATVMEQLAGQHQILVITHRAPIAARADTHFSVQKMTRKSTTFTELVEVEGTDRVEELARMIGDQDSRAALKLARQLMA